MATNKRLQVLFLPKWYPNSIDLFDGNFVQNYAEAIQLSCDVKVVFVHSKADLNNTYSIEKSTTKGVEEVKVYFKKSTLPFIGKLINTFRYIKGQSLGFNALSSKKIDISHIHVLTRSSFLALRLKNQFKIPIIISEHWSGYHPHNADYKGFFKKKFTEYVVIKSELIHVVSKQLGISMQQVGLKNNFISIGNVVDTSIFKPINHSNSVCKILYVGNLIQKHKQILDLVNCVGELSETRNDFEFHIYGEGDKEEELKKMIDSNNWNNRLFLKGTLDRSGIARVMAESDFLVLYSNSENQPCVINEAQACGLPVVVPAIAGIVERMHDRLGIVYPISDEKTFTAALNQMIKNYKNYDTKYISTFAEQEYSEPKIAEKFEALYLQTLAKNKA